MLLDWIASLDRGALAGVAVAMFALAVIGLGSLVAARWAPTSTDRPGLRLVVCGAIGINLFGLLVLATGFLGIINPISVWGALAALAAAAIVRERDTLLAALRHAWSNERIFLGAFLGIGGYFLGSTAFPPASWDSLVYQVTIPYRWMEIGRPDVLFDLPYSGFPCLLQLILWPLVTIGGITVPRILQWACYMFLFAALHALLRTRISKLPSIAIVVAFALSPISLIMVKDVYAEPLLMIDVVGGMALLIGRRDGTTPSLGPFVLIGALAGAACAVKLTGLGTAVVLFGLALWKLPRRSWGGAGLAFAIAAIALALPFFLRPWIQTGNPLYPFYARWFTADEATLATSLMHHAMGARYGVIPDVTGFLTTPFVVAFDGARFDGITLGWQFLALVVACAGLLVVEIRAKALTLAGGCAIGAVFLYVFWFFTAQQTRFLLPMYVIATIGAAGLIAHIERVRPVLRGLVVAVFVLATAEGVVREPSSIHYVATWQPGWRNDRIGQMELIVGKGYLRAVRAILAETPEDAKVLMMFERRGLYIPRRYEIGTPLFQAKHFTPPSESPRKVHRQILDAGFDYVLISPGRRNPDHLKRITQFQAPIKKALSGMAEKGMLELVWKGHGYRLMRVKPK